MSPRHVHACAAALLVLACPLSAGAQEPDARRCDRPEQRQFDFWVGTWEVFAPDGKKAGDNRIESIDGGCALLERWRGRGGFSGTSLNHWDAATRRWRQRWVDNQGGVLELDGGHDGTRMLLSGRLPHPERPGAFQWQRIGWTPQPDGSVRQLWEHSDDEGRRWTVAFDGLYRRARAAAPP